MASTSRKGRAASSMAWAINWWAWGTVKAGLFLPLQTQADKEQVRQSRMRHVAMPRRPGAGFVVIHTDFTLAVFQASLDRQPHSAHADELTPWASGRSVAEVDLELARGTQRPAEDHPHAPAGQLVAQRRRAQEGKLGHQRPFAAFLYHPSRPLRFGKTR